MDRPKQPGCLGSILTLMLIVVGIAICVGGMFITLDQTCAASIESWLRVYPGAERVSQETNFLRPNATGITITTYETNAPPWLVEQWYIGVTRQAGEFVQVRRLASVAWTVERQADGTGTTIEIYAECGNS
jgi:hypothetical protein